MIIPIGRARFGQTYVVVDENSTFFGSTIECLSQFNKFTECKIKHAIVDCKFEPEAHEFVCIANGFIKKLINIRDGFKIDEIELGKKYIVITGEDALLYCEFVPDGYISNGPIFYQLVGTAYNTKNPVYNKMRFYIGEYGDNRVGGFEYRFIPLENIEVVADYSVGF